MSILFAGCSFTNGMELKDKKKDRFSNIVAREFGIHEWNEGKVGAGNDYIQRTVFNAVLGNKKYWSTRPQPVDAIKYKRKPEPAQKTNSYIADMEHWMGDRGDLKDKEHTYVQEINKQREYEKVGTPNLVVCMWSGLNRLETLRKSKVTDDWSWTIGTWAQHYLDPKTLKAAKGSRPYVDAHHEYVDRKSIEIFMANVRNALYSYRLTIGSMLAVKYLLEAKGIHQLHYLFSHGQYRPLLPTLDWETYEQNNFWWESLDLNRKQLVEELPVLESEGFYDMCLRKGFKIGIKDHPLEDAHSHMANRIIEDIKKNEFHKEFK